MRSTLTQAAVYILLAIAAEARHGYGIMTEVRRMSAGAVRLGPGTLYTTLRRLLDAGLIQETDDRPDPALDDERRRYYSLTSAGRKALGAELRRLENLIAAAPEWALDDRR